MHPLQTGTPTPELLMQHCIHLDILIINRGMLIIAGVAVVATAHTPLSRVAVLLCPLLRQAQLGEGTSPVQGQLRSRGAALG